MNRKPQRSKLNHRIRYWRRTCNGLREKTHADSLLICCSFSCFFSSALLSAGSTAPHQTDVILMDINLPGISGIEALKILREDPATAHIPVVALSANAMMGDIEKGLQAGFFRYLSKPIKVREFTETLEVDWNSRH